MTTTEKLTAYTVTKKGEREFFSKIGVAFRHKSGKGFNLLLQSLPVDGKVILLPAKEKAQTAVAAG